MAAPDIPDNKLKATLDSPDSEGVNMASGVLDKFWQEMFGGGDTYPTGGPLLQGPKVTDTYLANLLARADKGTLTNLGLMNTMVTKAGLAHLAEFPALKEVYISESPRPEELEPLARLPALQKLDLNYNNVSDDQLEPLSRLPALQKLDLGFSSINGTGLAYLAELPALKNLSLYDTGLNDKGLASFAHGFPALESLNISRDRDVTDAALPYLAKLPALKSLYTEDFTTKGLAWFHEQRPDVEIYPPRDK